MQHSTVLHKIFSVLFLTFIAAAILQAQNPKTHNIGTEGSLTIHLGDPDYIITGITTSNTVTIESGYEGTVTLKDLKITKLSGNTNPPINVLGLNGRSNLDPITKVKIILDGNNSLELGASCSRISAFQVNQGAQIEINSIDRNDNSRGKLDAKSTPYKPGTVTTHPETGAGIGAPTSSGLQGTTQLSNGSSGNTAGGNIIIGSGTITAWGGHGAGIGGGYQTYYDGIIIVYGGDIEARAGRHAAGIGSGCPTGSGVISVYTPNSTIVALPPAGITGFGAKVDKTQLADLALAGAKNITYMNDPGKPHIIIKTEDEEPGANIYLDLTETLGLVDIFTRMGIDYDLKKVKIGKTNSSGTDLEKELHGRFEQMTTFFTDASSSKLATLGRPYMPVKKTVLVSETIALPLLSTEISFSDYPSKPLEVGYTAAQARANAHMIKVEYNDDAALSNLTFKLQDGAASDFIGIKFLKQDGITETAAPVSLNKGDIYYIVLPIVQGKPVGIYSDVLMIHGKWGTTDLPGYIRRIGMQRVVKDDTGQNPQHIKVEAMPNEFIDYTYPATKTVDLTLNIDHTGTNVQYDQDDVKAKFLITTEPDYNAALAATPISNWKDLNIPAANGQNQTTTVSFSNEIHGTYYIHWYVESGVVYAHSQTVTIPPSRYGGFGPYIITDPVKAGILTGNPSVCIDQIPSEIKGDISSGGSGEFFYQWQMRTNTTSWTNVGGDTPNYTPTPLTESPTYYQRITIDKKYEEVIDSYNVFAIYIVSDDQTLYWKQNATNSNWNDPSNWVNASGVALNMIPVSCSNVYIPGGANFYPSLHIDKTPIDIYGSPICNNITFAYGAELAYQHKLSYEKAYVQYNWGYYGNLSQVNYGDQPTQNDCSPALANKRDVWYALAAPLKSMATGDFTFAGYPLTWQSGFALSDPNTGLKGNEIEVGDFDKKFSTNDTPLSETNNAIAIKIAAYKNSIGCSDHSNMEGLKGIIEIPYFENKDKSDYYPGHIYDRFTQISKFFYFNPKTLQLLHSPVGHMKRSNEAYRFIYEKEDVAPDITVGGIPSTVPGYEQQVERQSSTSLKVMIGNPFMASINAKQFIDANNFDPNNIRVDESQGYQLFSSEEQRWKHYSFGRGGSIPPLQAFIITLNKEEANLLFPLEGTYALTGGGATRNVPSALDKGSLYMKSVDKNGLGGDYSVLVSTATEESAANIKKMIYSQGHTTPETFFITPDNKNYNLIQMYEKGIREVRIGVKSSDTKNPLSLTFENVNDFITANNLSPVLLDKHLGVRQNLISKNSYDFTQRRVEAENKYIDADRFVLQLLSADQLLDVDADISIVYNDKYKQIEVRASQNIKQIQIYDVLGRQMYSESGINTSNYVTTLSLQQGVYIVKVYTENGEIKVDKIMAL